MGIISRTYFSNKPGANRAGYQLLLEGEHETYLYDGKEIELFIRDQGIQQTIRATVESVFRGQRTDGEARYCSFCSTEKHRGKVTERINGYVYVYPDGRIKSGKIRRTIVY